MDRKTAKELFHIQSWLERVEEVVDKGEAANRLSKLDVLAPNCVETGCR